MEAGTLGERVVPTHHHRESLQHDRPVGELSRPWSIRPWSIQIVDAAEAGVDLVALDGHERGAHAAAHAQLDHQLGALAGSLARRRTIRCGGHI
jgi:hypothetical protein